MSNPNFKKLDRRRGTIRRNISHVAAIEPGQRRPQLEPSYSVVNYEGKEQNGVLREKRIRRRK
jgi:hypothetical protein